MMRFKENANVLDESGEKVGTIDRVVMDPRTKQVSHVVIREGVLFTENKVVPVEWFDLTTEDKVVLKTSEEDVDALPPFVETHYIPWHEAESRRPNRAQVYYWNPPSGVSWWGYPGYRAYFGFLEPPYAKTTELQIPEGTVPLEEGADVISSDNEHVGSVEQIFTDPETGRATHFVISQGLLFKDRKLVPTAWIESMSAGRVSLGIDADFLETIESYED